MLVLGIESSCDETGVALVEATGATVPALRAHALHSQIDMHQAYGGVVPELASRDHVQRVVPLVREVLGRAGVALADLSGIAYTQGPGLAGALLVGASVASAASRISSIERGPSSVIACRKEETGSGAMAKPEPRSSRAKPRNGAAARGRGAPRTIAGTGACAGRHRAGLRPLRPAGF